MRRTLLLLTLPCVALLLGPGESLAKPSLEDRCTAFLLKATQKSIGCRIRLARAEILTQVDRDLDHCDRFLERAVLRADRRFRGQCPSVDEAQSLAGIHAEATETLVGAVAAPAWQPSQYTYVAFTIDDSLRNSDMTALQGLLALSQNSDAQYTYFTRNYYTDYAAVETWHAMGHEVANHTVAHGGETEGYAKEATQWTQTGKASWIQELKNQDEIIELWGNVPKTDVVGFRAPNLAANQDLFLGAFPIWAQSKITDTNKIVYDSSIAITPSRVTGFPPPFRPKDCQSVIKNHTGTDWHEKIMFCQKPDESTEPDCTQRGTPCYGKHWAIEDVTIDGFWEIPITALLHVDPTKGAYGIQVPSVDGETKDQVKATLEYNYQLAKKTHTPLMIAIHTSWLQQNGTNNVDAINEWMTDLVQNRSDEARVVTVAQLVTMYAAQDEDAIVPNPKKDPRCDYTQAQACTGNAPSTSQGAPTSARCDSQCGSPDYGGNPGGTPPCNATLPIGTTTCNDVCGASVDGSDFTPGAAAWLGNVGGNCKTGTDCNYYPASAAGGADTCPVAAP